MLLDRWVSTSEYEQIAYFHGLIFSWQTTFLSFQGKPNTGIILHVSVYVYESDAIQNKRIGGFFFGGNREKAGFMTVLLLTPTCKRPWSQTRYFFSFKKGWFERKTISGWEKVANQLKKIDRKEWTGDSAAFSFAYFSEIPSIEVFEQWPSWSKVSIGQSWENRDLRLEYVGSAKNHLLRRELQTSAAAFSIWQHESQQ